jgi:hypothetical protein
MSYKEFIKNKKHSLSDSGFNAKWLPESGFDFQNFIIDKTVKKGRYGVFADTGLGKTLIQLALADNRFDREEMVQNDLIDLMGDVA